MTTAITDNIKRDIRESEYCPDDIEHLDQIIDDSAELYQYDNNDLIEMIETATEELKRRLS
jgi:hypothetical protein